MKKTWSHWAIAIGVVATLFLGGCGPVVVRVENGPVVAATSSPGRGAAAAETAIVPGAQQTESALALMVTYLTFFAEMCGALVIGVAVVRGVVRFVPHILRRGTSANENYSEDIRLQLGKSLALALEFELGADILKTAVVPSISVIAQLAAIVVLRTLLNYFLERELRQVEQRRAGLHLAPTAAPERAG